MTKRIVWLVVPLVTVVALAACSTSSSKGATPPTSATAKPIDYKALGLWDDGPCDPAKPPLIVGTMTVFESPVLSMKDQATALDAAATAFNKRGGANGACIKVHNCDDGADPQKAVACVREIDQAGVDATVNDLGTVAQADVEAAMEKAGIPRVAGNITPDDWAGPLMYPLDSSSTGAALLFPEALLQEGVTDMGMVRVDVPATNILDGLMTQVYGKKGAKILFDAPVPAGTTDYSQFILGAQEKGAKGLMLLLGDQDAVQVVHAGQQLGTDMQMATTPGSFSHATMRSLGQFANQMVFFWSYPPATYDLPVYQALRSDLAASGDPLLQPETLKASPMQSWIGLYALLRVLRDAHVTTFTRASIAKALNAAKNVPMLGIFGGENWTPSLDHPGTIKRAGVNHWAIYRWDPNAKSNGFDGNFVERESINFDQVLCGSALGGPCNG